MFQHFKRGADKKVWPGVTLQSTIALLFSCPVKFEAKKHDGNQASTQDNASNERGSIKTLATRFFFIFMSSCSWWSRAGTSSWLTGGCNMKEIVIESLILHVRMHTHAPHPPTTKENPSVCVCVYQKRVRKLYIPFVYGACFCNWQHCQAIVYSFQFPHCWGIFTHTVCTQVPHVSGPCHRWLAIQSNLLIKTGWNFDSCTYVSFLSLSFPIILYVHLFQYQAQQDSHLFSTPFHETWNYL